MANIRKEGNRHDWLYRKAPRGAGGKNNLKEMYVCRNCGRHWDEEKYGSPPTNDCIYENKMILLGRSRMDDIEERVVQSTGDFNPSQYQKV